MSRPHILSAHQREQLEFFVRVHLLNVLDEEFHAPYLINDVLIANNMSDDINARKRAALSYVVELLQPVK